MMERGEESTFASSPREATAGRSDSYLCPGCELNLLDPQALKQFKFCPATGEPHSIPNPACSVCGLRTPFCPVDGTPHDQAVGDQLGTLLRPGEEDDARPPVRVIQRAPKGVGAAAQSRGSLPMAGGGGSSNRGGGAEGLRQRKKPKTFKATASSEETQKVVAALGGDAGYGIFLSDNPVLKRAQPVPRPSSTAEKQNFGEDFYTKTMARGECNEMLNAPDEADSLIAVLSGRGATDSLDSPTVRRARAQRMYGKHWYSPRRLLRYFNAVFLGGQGVSRQSRGAVIIVLVVLFLAVRRMVWMWTHEDSFTGGINSGGGYPSGLEPPVYTQ